MLLTAKDGSTVRYVTPQFLLRSTVRWYGTFFFVMERVLYAVFVKVLVRYVDTLLITNPKLFAHYADFLYTEAKTPLKPTLNV